MSIITIVNDCFYITIISVIMISLLCLLSLFWWKWNYHLLLVVIIALHVILGVVVITDINIA